MKYKNIRVSPKIILTKNIRRGAEKQKMNKKIAEAINISSQPTVEIILPI